jgi:serine/threonine-protein kinase
MSSRSFAADLAFRVHQGGAVPQPSDAATMPLPVRGVRPSTGPLPRLAVGERLPIGRYDAIAFLAEGGMGSVYLAVDRATGERVALKVLDPRLAASEDVVARFLSELAISASVRHDGLVRVLDGGRGDDAPPHLALELLDGESLGDLIERARIELGAVAAIGAQIADAIAALHAARVVHCDLKPDNVFVLYEAGLAGWPRIKVIDFGVAQRLDGAAIDGDLLFGTPAYMAPEQWHGRIDEASDVYALGCVLYELVTGRAPFHGTMVELMSAHADRLPTPPRAIRPDVPRELEALILRMLAKDQRMRPRAMGELARELGDLAFAMPPGARVPVRSRRSA